MIVTPNILAVLAGKGNIFPTGVTGIYSIKGKISLKYRTGEIVSVNRFTDDGRVQVRMMDWKLMSEFTVPEEAVEIIKRVEREAAAAAEEDAAREEQNLLKRVLGAVSAARMFA